MQPTTYPCGHPKTPENTTAYSRVVTLLGGREKVYDYEYCRTCRNRKNAYYMRGTRLKK